MDGWKFSRCPLKVVTRQSFEYIQAYNFYKAGFLPNPGGWMEQPIKLLEIFSFIENAVNETEKK